MSAEYWRGVKAWLDTNPYPSKPRKGWVYGQSMHPERDAAITKARASGLKLKEISATFGLTKERIRQIVAKETRNGRGA